MARVVLVLICTLSGCASAAPLPAPRPLPSDPGQRDRALSSFGHRLYGAFATGDFDQVVATDRARDALLEPDAARRPIPGASGGEKLGPDARIAASDQAIWRSARYAGLCIQSGRDEPPSGAIGLRSTGFVFERGLLIGREPGGGELAGWVEGVFVLTADGFVAIAIERIESPRRDHSDLELAECELADHADTPQDVVPLDIATH